MTTITLKYVHAFKDRHGKQRYYFRRRGYKQVALPGLPGSREFIEAYHAALGGRTVKPAEIGAERTKEGSINHVIAAYYRSAGYLQLSPGTQIVYRRIIEKFRADHGEKPVRSLERKHIYKIVQDKADKPAAANRLLSLIHILLDVALDLGLRDDNPASFVKRIKVKTEGFYTWNELDIRKYEDYWPVGTTQRTVFDLLLYTAQRGSDVRTMGRQNLTEDGIRVRQLKTGAWVTIPIHPQLKRSLATVPAGQLTFVLNQFGRPFSPKGFGQWFVRCVKAAGLPPGVSAHGLRKACSRRLAEAGCSPSMIMAITGHTTLAEVTRYTKAADRVGLAKLAIERLSSSTNEDEE